MSQLIAQMQDSLVASFNHAALGSSSLYDGFISRFSDRSNLSLYTDSKVTRLYSLSKEELSKRYWEAMADRTILIVEII